ncbi:MAG: Mut7-C RNAse domain-containing protein [Anaerolineae bacterium]|jgi:uncharacterized protein with PIN domain|nr:Mut7-C RNAse domain-containing protein [Anaerolineae bacterium]
MVSQESAPPQKAQPQGDLPALFVDAMLGRLARWLRLAGYDTAFWREGSDEQLIAAARDQGRVIVTKDRGLAGRRGVDAVRIDADALDEQIAEARAALARRGPIPEPFTRCAECNGPIEWLPPEQARDLVPLYVRETQREFRRCAACGRVYWKGTHWPAVQGRLAGSDLTRSEEEGRGRV